MNIAMRISLLLLAFLSLPIPVSARSATTRPGEDKRPNILLLIADDMSWCHAGFAGDAAVHTPAMDRLARDGVEFHNAHCFASSCTPSRGALLTGRPIWQLEEGANLWGTIPSKFTVYPQLLERAGYIVGLRGKGWGPGDFKPGGWDQNPAGPNTNIHKILTESASAGKPFCFWMGSHKPHRPYPRGIGAKNGIDLSKIKVPPMLPDVPQVRNDIADYLFEVQQFDKQVAGVIDAVEKAGVLDNTLVILTSDNGMPFPRAKSTLYQWGTREPLIALWPAKFKGGRSIDDPVSLMDLAPTFLDAAGITPPKEMVGRSILPMLTSGKSGKVDPARDHILLGNERHADVRAGHHGYPRRAIQTADYLYIRNFAPNRWPAGDPPGFSDVDQFHPTSEHYGSKDFLLMHRDDPKYHDLFELDFGKRPAEELFDLKTDPDSLHNVAGDPKYGDVKAKLRKQLDDELVATHDPRMTGGKVLFDTYPYYGKIKWLNDEPAAKGVGTN
jgi:arylsulfatase A-like enzyme